MKYVISVAKAYKHRGKMQHKTAKKHWFVYFYEYDEFEETWHMETKQVNLLQAVYYMTQKHHRLKMICPDCGSMFLGLVKSFREKIECPNCLKVSKIILDHGISLPFQKCPYCEFKII